MPANMVPGEMPMGRQIKGLKCGSNCPETGYALTDQGLERFLTKTVKNPVENSVKNPDEPAIMGSSSICTI